MAASGQQAALQIARVPKLSYRKTLPQDELDKIKYAPREYTPPPKAAARNVSVRETVDVATGPKVSQPQPRKKSSILTGFFSKEPTISALAQVEVDLINRHGAATSHTVPHVSSRKMPEHVPKVNSKWDGIPETVKMREREDKERKRLSQAGNFTQSQMRSRGSNESIRDTFNSQQSRFIRRDSDTASHTDSWQSQTDTSGRPHRHQSFSSATSSNGSQEVKAHQTASVKTQSLRSPSGNSLPEITSFFPHHQPQKAAQPTHVRKGSRIQATRTGTTRSDVTSIDSIPEHSSSPVATPREKSPATPVYGDERERHPGPLTSHAVSNGAVGSKVSKGRVKHTAMDAFLAGEAKPIELDDDDDDDDDSSTNTTFRTELPMRQAQTPQKARAKVSSTMNTPARTVQVDRIVAAPWEMQQPNFSKHTAPAMTKNRMPKALAAFK